MKPKKGSNRNLMGIISIIVWALVITLLMNYFTSMFAHADSTEIYFSEFLDLVDEGKVDEVKIESGIYTITLTKEGEREWLEEQAAEAAKETPPATNGLTLPELTPPAQNQTGQTFTLYTAPLSYPDLVQYLRDHNVKVYTPYQEATSPILIFLASYVDRKSVV